MKVVTISYEDRSFEYEMMIFKDCKIIQFRYNL